QARRGRTTPAQLQGVMPGGRRKAGDGRRKTEDRRRKTDGGRRKTDLLPTSVFPLPPAHGEEDGMSPQVQRVVVLLVVIGLVAVASGTLHSHDVRASYLAAAGVALLLGSCWL